MYCINLNRWLAVELIALLVMLACLPTVGNAADQWFRGQLHTHTYLSDGRAFPEEAVYVYKQRGFNFLCLSDHNKFADNKQEWRDVFPDAGTWPPKITQKALDSYIQLFGKDKVDVRQNGNITSVRLKTYDEVKAQLEEKNKFIMMPGVEITQDQNGKAVHMNCLNLPAIIPSLKNASLIQGVSDLKEPVQLIGRNAAETEALANQLGRQYILMLNHPFWVYYDVRPESLIDCPEVKFFEICNGGSDFAPYSQVSDYTPDKFWDIVNAFRCTKGKPLLYGVGSDDTHYYDTNNVGESEAWIVVRASKLTSAKLLTAIHKGYFYSTTGVELEEVVFTPRKRTLRVKVKEEPGVKYQIHFITTKKDFNQQVSEVKVPAEKNRPARTVPDYSDEIGRIAKTVEGISASYKMEADDLYVRARIESSRPNKIVRHFFPKQQTAWTQPYTHLKLSLK